MKKIYVVFVLFLFVTAANGQGLLLTENFDYPVGTALRDSGWYPHSGAATNPLAVTATGLSLGNTPYFGNNIGRAALVNNTGADENKPFTANKDTGSVYASFLLKTAGEITTDGSGFFFHLVEYSNPTTPVYTAISTAFRARTYITTGSTAANFRLGLTFNSATVPSTVGVDVTNDLDTSKTYLVVVKYTFVSGADNDQVSLFVFDDGDSLRNEPSTPTLGPFTGTAADVTVLQGVALRQFNANQKVIVDGIYVRDQWLLQPDNTSIFDQTFENQLKVYPNPYASGPLKIETSNNKPLKVNLMDLSGRSCFQSIVEAGEIQLPAQRAGIYMLKFEQDHKIAFKKLVIQ